MKAALFIASLLAASTCSADVSISDAPARRAASLSAPVLARPADMGVRAGETADQAITATDADGDPLTFSTASGPTYMTVTTIDPGSGSATGSIHLAPSPSNEGISSGSVSVSDGATRNTQSFRISVFPFLETVAAMTVEEGATADQILIAHDPGHVVTFRVVGAAPYVSVTSTSDSTADLHLAPGEGDSGPTGGTVTIQDGSASYTVPLFIWVSDPHLMTQPADMHAVPGTVTEQILSASAPDPQGSYLTFAKASGPGYVTVGNLSSSPHRGYVRLTPTLADTGEAIVTVQVSNRLLLDLKTFHVRVDLQNSRPVVLLQDVDLDEGESRQEVVRAIDPEGQRLTISATGVPRFMSFTPNPQVISTDTLTAVIRLDPGFADAGAYAVAVHVTDGLEDTVDTLHVTVHDVTEETSLSLRLEDGSEYKYAAVDGRFDCGGFYDVGFSFSDTLGSGAQWFFHFSNPVEEGDLDDRGFTFFGSDPTADISTCFVGPVHTTIRRIVRKTDGSIRTFWATFEYTCGDGTPGFRGEMRYQVPVPITLVAPRWIRAEIDEPLLFPVTGSVTPLEPQSISSWGRPPGATFVDSGNGHGVFAWTPPSGAVGDHIVKFTSLTSTGAADTAFTTIHVVTATVTLPDSASAAQVTAGGVSRPIRLEAGNGRLCVALETVAVPSDIMEIDPSSIRLQIQGLGSTDTAPADPASVVVGDANGNGNPDATVCFGNEALRPLFSHVSGSLHSLTTVEFALKNGRVFRASLPLDIVAPDGALRPLIAPNPLRPAGTFSFVTTVEGPARLILFDTRGRRVRTLIDLAALPTGYHDLRVDTRDANDRALPSGIYYYRLETKEGTRTGRITLLR